MVWDFGIASSLRTRLTSTVIFGLRAASGQAWRPVGADVSHLVSGGLDQPNGEPDKSAGNAGFGPRRLTYLVRASSTAKSPSRA